VSNSIENCIIKTLLNILNNLHTPLSNCCGQAYDFGNNLKGTNSNTQSLIIRENPRARYILCCAHSSIPVVSDAAKSSVTVMPLRLALYKKIAIVCLEHEYIFVFLVAFIFCVKKRHKHYALSIWSCLNLCVCVWFFFSFFFSFPIYGQSPRINRGPKSGLFWARKDLKPALLVGYW
jgi:hypothetical protein